jgi:hypothetical protein
MRVSKEREVKSEIQYLVVTPDSRDKWKKEKKRVALRRMKVLNYIYVFSGSP